MKKLLIISVISLLPFQLLAQEQAEDDGGLLNYKKLFLDENGKWSVGVGTIVRNSPFRGEKISAFPFPIIDYSSRNLFIRELKAGYHIKRVENPYEGGFFVDGFIGARMRPGDSRRKFSVDAGLKGGYQHPFGALAFSFSQDVTNASDGKEASVSYSLTFLNSSKKSIIIPRLTMTWQDQKMANYLWGISQDVTNKMLLNMEEVVLQPYRITKPVINYSAGIIHIYKFDENWSSILGAQLAALDTAILDNPAIERQLDYSFILGAAYTF